MRFIGAAIGGALALAVLLSPPAIDAQDKVPRIGVLVTGPRPDEHVCVLALRRGLSELGYVEGRTHALDIRWGEEPAETSMPRLSRELVKRGVDLVVTVTSQGLGQARPALASVPVVMASSNYPVERGLIQSLSHPGGNITGIATFTAGMFDKRMQLLAEALPRAGRIAVLRLPGEQNDYVVRDLEPAAQQVGMKLHVIEVRRAEDFPSAFETAVRGGAQGIMTTQGPFFLQQIRQFADLALRHKLPSFSGEPTAANAGVLMSAGASIPASCQRAATYVDRILKGAKPADLPVEQPTTVGLEINLKTAKALGIVIPPSLVLRADQIIE